MEKNKKRDEKNKKEKLILFSDIKVSKEPPLDKNLLKLLSWARKQKAPYQNAWINIDLIKPHCDYEPQIHPEYVEYFTERLEDKNPALVLVYEKNGRFVMSDDYNAFYFYKRNGFKKIPCWIIGKYKKRKGVCESGEPYQEGEVCFEEMS